MMHGDTTKAATSVARNKRKLGNSAPEVQQKSTKRFKHGEASASKRKYADVCSVVFR